jgi:hypothetical protein
MPDDRLTAGICIRTRDQEACRMERAAGEAAARIGGAFGEAAALGAVQPTPDHDAEGDETLIQLQASFPQFRIWREITHDRPRYIARSRHPGVGPHTVITPDPDELRTALAR